MLCSQIKCVVCEHRREKTKILEYDPHKLCFIVTMSVKWHGQKVYTLPVNSVLRLNPHLPKAKLVILISPRLNTHSDELKELFFAV